MSAIDLQERFLKQLPRIEAHARFAFRRMNCPHARDDLRAETVALAWKHFASLVGRGKAPERFITTLARRCAQAARNGRRVAGGFRRREAMPQKGTARRALTRIPLADAENSGGGWLSEALREDTQTPVPLRVAFQMDFTAWRGLLNERKQAVLDALAKGAGTCEAAKDFDVCPARVSQLRREFADGWRVFRAG